MTDTPFMEADLEAICPSVKTLGDEEFVDRVLDRMNRSRSVVVLFFKSSCPHCHTLAALLEPLAARGLPIVKMDCGVSRQTADRFAIHSYPKLALFRGGALRDLYAFERTSEQLEAWINHHSRE